MKKALKKLTVLSIVFTSLTSLVPLRVGAQTLYCQFKVNLDLASDFNVETQLQKRVQVTDFDEAVSYVTETTPDHFSIEMYLPGHDLRIYSEGVLTSNQDHLTASAWARDRIVELSCQKK